VSYPPVGPGGNEQQQQPQGRQPAQGGWPASDPAATQPMSPPTAEYPVAGPPGPGPVNPGPFDSPPPGATPPEGTYQPPYYQVPPQNPYAQQQYPYAQGQQPYPYQYDPNLGGYGPPMPGQGAGSQSRNAMIATLVAVAVLVVGVSVYWFGFRNHSANSTAIAHGSTLAGTGATSAAASPSASPSPTPNALGTDQAGQLQALMATMNDAGCRAAFQALITFEQASTTDANDYTALLTDYDTAIAGLTSAQQQSQNAAAADAIGQVVSDWKTYTAALAGGQTPPDSTLTTDAEQLTAACLAS
jgi:hypothetical protein